MPADLGNTGRGSTVRKDYTYEIVTSNGAGVYAKGFDRCSDARKALERYAQGAYTPGVVFEVQRVEWINGGFGVRRYWMRQRSRWVPWDAHRGPEVRQPDWHVVSEGRG